MMFVAEYFCEICVTWKNMPQLLTFALAFNNMSETDFVSFFALYLINYTCVSPNEMMLENLKTPG